jgi:nucleoside-diphosphate-sugar epimerase
MAKYIVTGAAGFIAARVVEMLAEAGHDVVGIDNLNNAYDVRLKEWRLRKMQTLPGFKFIREDISDRNIIPLLKENATGCSAIINLAARAGVRSSVIDPWEYYRTNVDGALNMLECCCQYQIPKFVQASSSSVYGDKNPMPYREDANTDQPLQPYAASKKASEVLSYAYHYLHGVDVTIFRYFTVYGPAARPDMAMFRFVQWITEGRPVKINGDGNQTRGFTYVDDIARGTIQGLQPVGYEIINLGGHEQISMNDLVHLFEQKTGNKAMVEYQPIHKADAQANWADSGKAIELLKWKPQVSLDEGVSRLVNWYYAERTWASQVMTE